jgi:hypothetical protein
MVINKCQNAPDFGSVLGGVVTYSLVILPLYKRYTVHKLIQEWK